MKSCATPCSAATGNCGSECNHLQAPKEQIWEAKVLCLGDTLPVIPLSPPSFDQYVRIKEPTLTCSPLPAWEDITVNKWDLDVIELKLVRKFLAKCIFIKKVSQFQD